MTTPGTDPVATKVAQARAAGAEAAYKVADARVPHPDKEQSEWFYQLLANAVLDDPRVSFSELVALLEEAPIRHKQYEAGVGYCDRDCPGCAWTERRRRFFGGDAWPPRDSEGRQIYDGQ